jgi:putative selenate reductase
MDVARTVKRLIPASGSVKVIYRRAKKDMPADQEEITALVEEGIEIIEHVDIKEIKDINGDLYSLIMQRMKPGEKDTSGRNRPVAIDGSEFELIVDTLIPAVGQDLEIFINDSKLLKTQAGSFETQIENVFIGGDAHHGAATIIKAIADGRFAANEMIKKYNSVHGISDNKIEKAVTENELSYKKTQRRYGVPVREISLSDRKDFKLVQFPMTESEVKEEASRCLYCDEICNVCTTVCPNGANYSYTIEPAGYALQKIKVESNGEFSILEDKKIELTQKYQIVNIGNWCNECGNCATFCPTSGAPYKDKPKLYLTRDAFSTEDKAYYIEKFVGMTTIYYRERNELFELSKSGDFFMYKTNQYAVSLFADSLQVKDVKILSDSIAEIRLEKALKMALLLDNISHLAFERN